MKIGGLYQAKCILPAWRTKNRTIPEGAILTVLKDIVNIEGVHAVTFLFEDFTWIDYLHETNILKCYKRVWTK
jgi:hypothetical protein